MFVNDFVSEIFPAFKSLKFAVAHRVQKGEMGRGTQGVNELAISVSSR